MKGRKRHGFIIIAKCIFDANSAFFVFFSAEKHIPVPVEKVVHYPVKVNIPKPYPVVKNVPYPVKKKIHIPVHIPAPYPVGEF